MWTEKYYRSQEIKESFQSLKPFINKRLSCGDESTPKVLHTPSSGVWTVGRDDPSLGEKFAATNAIIFPSVEQGT